MSDDFFQEKNLAQSNWFRFEKIGDTIKGTLVNVSKVDGQDGYSDQIVYEIKKEDGEFWKVGISVTKTGLNDRMRNAKLGQIVGFKFNKEIPSKKKGYAAAKGIDGYLGEMDTDYEAENIAEELGGEVVNDNPNDPPFN